MEGDDILAGFWDFLSTLVSSKKDKDSSSVVVKNYISGNNNQKNNTTNKGKGGRGNGNSKYSGPSQSSPKAKGKTSSSTCVKLQSIQLYSTGSNGKVYTERFYKSINHNFGIEVVLKNTSSRIQTIHLGHCIYDESGNVVFHGNFTPKINPHSTVTHNIFVDAKAFAKMKSGIYKSQFWINDTKVQKAFFTVAYK